MKSVGEMPDILEGKVWHLCTAVLLLISFFLVGQVYVLLQSSQQAACVQILDTSLQCQIITIFSRSSFSHVLIKTDRKCPFGEPLMIFGMSGNKGKETAQTPMYP